MRALRLSLLWLLPLLGATPACDDDPTGSLADYLECEGANQCDLQCPATGACTVDVAGAAQATVRCATGGCTVTCGPNARCAVSCGTGACDVTCNGSTACTQSCKSGACRMTCDADTQSCQQLPGSGEATCSGCG